MPEICCLSLPRRHCPCSPCRTSKTTGICDGGTPCHQPFPFPPHPPTATTVCIPITIPLNLAADTCPTSSSAPSRSNNVLD